MLSHLKPKKHQAPIEYAPPLANASPGSVYQAGFLLPGERKRASFFGHLSYPFLTDGIGMMYSSSIVKKRKQGTCWSTSISLMVIKNNILPSKMRYAWSNSSATSACVCGWMVSAFPKTTCRPIVLSLPENIPLPLASTPKLVKLAPIVHGSLSHASMRTVASTSLERKAIRSSNTTTGASSTRRRDGNLILMASISPSPMAVGLADSAWLATRNSRLRPFPSRRSSAFALSAVQMAGMRSFVSKPSGKWNMFHQVRSSGLMWGLKRS